MGKTKIQCHICYNIMKTAKGEEVPVHCTLCATDLINKNTETQTHRTVVQHEAGGVKADLVEILLTDHRLIFKEDGMSGVGGGLIVGAISGMLSRNSSKYNAIMLADIVATHEEIFGLFKNKVRHTIQTNSGAMYTFNLSKRETEKWRPGLRKFVTA
ncbi:MAG: hypothetical protein FWC71_01445 [Defluviitaleaceae bacterium]|nr:hypothetical protein [Defluviitaleaceae bacterium]